MTTPTTPRVQNPDVTLKVDVDRCADGTIVLTADTGVVVLTLEEAATLVLRLRAAIRG